MTDNNYSECVDYLVSQMNSQSSPTNAQQSFEDFKAQVDKQREHISEVGITEALYELGYKVDTLLAKLIELCDKILKEEKSTN